MKLHHVLLVAASSVFLAACSAGSMTTATPSPAADTQMMVAETPAPMMSKKIVLTEQNKLGQSGQAVISEGPNGNAVVTLTMTGGTFTAPQPAHIHLGSCPNPGAVKYPLTNVVDGKSVTTLDASYEDIVNATDKLAVNVHKSAAESKVYTACGDVN